MTGSVSGPWQVAETIKPDQHGNEECTPLPCDEPMNEAPDHAAALWSARYVAMNAAILFAVRNVSERSFRKFPTRLGSPMAARPKAAEPILWSLQKASMRSNISASLMSACFMKSYVVGFVQRRK